MAFAKVAHEVDRRVVVNPAHARALLEAVRAQQPSGPQLVAAEMPNGGFGYFGRGDDLSALADLRAAAGRSGV